jgi:hypothetical protein
MKYFTSSSDTSCPFFKVEGWVNVNVPDLVRFLAEMMHSFGFECSRAGEIGVHHGRFFLLLENMCTDGEGVCDAFDVFEDQYRNLDGSGRGSLSTFKDNVAKYALSPSRVRIFKVDSMDLRTPEWSKERLGRYDIFSIDGSHTALHTCNDLMFAEQHLETGGICIVDDINNISFMGVAEGVSRYLGGGSARLAPFGVGLNKLLLAPVGEQARYFAYLKAKASQLPFPPVQGAPNTTRFHGYDVFRYG